MNQIRMNDQRRRISSSDDLQVYEVGCIPVQRLTVTLDQCEIIN
jgi:hypothetical protein